MTTTEVLKCFAVFVVEKIGVDGGLKDVMKRGQRKGKIVKYGFDAT